MDYRDDEYLKLFKQVKEQNVQTTNYSYDQLRSSGQMLKETPDYSNYNNPTNYNQNLNFFQLFNTRIFTMLTKEAFIAN